MQVILNKFMALTPAVRWSITGLLAALGVLGLMWGFKKTRKTRRR